MWRAAHGLCVASRIRHGGVSVVFYVLVVFHFLVFSDISPRTELDNWFKMSVLQVQHVVYLVFVYSLHFKKEWEVAWHINRPGLHDHEYDWLCPLWHTEWLGRHTQG